MTNNIETAIKERAEMPAEIKESLRELAEKVEKKGQDGAEFLRQHDLRNRPTTSTIPEK